MLDAAMTETMRIAPRGRALVVADAAAVREALPAFTGPFEAGTLAFFDAVLPECWRMIDGGAHVGLTALYAASHGVEVTAFEPNPASLEVLRLNLALNGAASGVRVVAAALGAADGRATLFAKAAADSGSSLFRRIERDAVIAARPVAEIEVCDIGHALAGADRRTLIKLDVEGAEYDLIPAIGDVLAASLPPLHVSFHPFNLVADNDYETALLRAEAGLRVARTLACYPHAYGFVGERCVHFGPADRPELLREYLFKPKPVPRVATAQYGFVEAWGFTAEPVPDLPN